MMSGPSAITGKIATTKTTTPAPKTSSGLTAAEKKSIAAGLGNVAKDTTKALGLIAQYLGSDSTGSTGSTNTGLSGNRTDASYIAEGRSGTSNTGQHYVEGKLASDEEWQKFLGGGSGGINKYGTSDSGNVQTVLQAQQQADRQSAYDILLGEFTKYGLASLVEPLKGFIVSGSSPSELTIQLQNTDAYKKRFAANADRIAKGLTALSPAEYIAMEDQYQNIMRNYGLPDSYYAKGDLGVQPGFQQLLANDVSATELEDRVLTAQNRVQNANPEVYKALKAFYPDITNGDILAYTLDPTKALDMIKRKVTAAEIGGAALSQGLTTSAQSAEDLARYGVTKQQAQQGYENIAGMLPRASQLSDIYKQDPYTQATAEADVFGTTGSATAKEKRKKLTALEQASFAGSSGAANNALSRDKAFSPYMMGTPGAGAF
jgi:hypothetical protein